MKFNQMFKHIMNIDSTYNNNNILNINYNMLYNSYNMLKKDGI